MKEVFKVVVNQIVAELNKEDVKKVITDSVTNVFSNCMNALLESISAKTVTETIEN